MSLLVPTLNAWGAAFVGFALPMLAQSSIVIVFLLALDLALRRKARATVRYAVCLLALVKLVLPPTLALPTGVAYWLAEQTIVKPFDQSFPASSPDVRFAPEAVTDNPSLSPTPVSLPKLPRTSLVEAPVSPALSWQADVLIVWLAVGAALAVWVFRRGRLVSRLIRKSIEAPEPLLELAEPCREQLRIRRSVPVRCSPDIGSPAIAGLWRPMILIPSCLAENLRESEMRSVLLHELAHVKRGDLWVNHAQILLQLVYWYNPLVWLANARIRRLREQAVDEMTLVELGGEAESYPETLLRVAKMEIRRIATPAGVVGIIGSGRALTVRISSILNRPLPTTATVGITGLLAVVLLGLMALPMACGRDKREAASAQGKSALAEPATTREEPPFVDSTGSSEEPATAANYAIHAQGNLRSIGEWPRFGYWTNEYSFTADVAGDKWRFRLVPLHPDYSTRRSKVIRGTSFDMTPDQILAYSDGTNFCWSSSFNAHWTKMMERGDVKVRQVKEFPMGGSGAIPYTAQREITGLFYAYASHLYLQKLGQPGFIDPLSEMRGEKPAALTDNIEPPTRWKLLPQAPGLPLFLLNMRNSNWVGARYRMSGNVISAARETKESIEPKAPHTNLVYEVTETKEVGGFLIPKESRLTSHNASAFLTISLQTAHRGNNLLTAPPPAQFTAYVNEMTVLSNQAAASARMIPPGPPLQVGQPAPSFEAKTTTGQIMRFPESYRGKVVLLEFWAVAHYVSVPSMFGRNADLAAAYAKLHRGGFEILAVDLAPLEPKGSDDDRQTTELRRRLNIPWPQVQDTKRWRGDAAVKYGVARIPYAFLLDGDTGMILAEGEALRGPALIPTVEKALASKQGK